MRIVAPVSRQVTTKRSLWPSESGRWVIKSAEISDQGRSGIGKGFNNPCFLLPPDFASPTSVAIPHEPSNIMAHAGLIRTVFVISRASRLCRGVPSRESRAIFVSVTFAKVHNEGSIKRHDNVGGLEGRVTLLPSEWLPEVPRKKEI